MLSQTYRAIYGTNDDEELILRTAPLSATSEVQSLFSAGLLDYESCLPAALHSLGCSSEEISSALERRRKAEKEADDMKKIENKTVKAELGRREKDAINPPKDGSAAKQAAPAAKKPSPSKPDSD